MPKQRRRPHRLKTWRNLGAVNLLLLIVFPVATKLNEQSGFLWVLLRLIDEIFQGFENSEHRLFFQGGILSIGVINVGQRLSISCLVNLLSLV